MLKLVVAYIDSQMFDSVRRGLTDHGIGSFSAGAAGGVSDYTFAAPNYRGSVYTEQLPEKIRIECVVGATHVDAVREIVFKNEGRKSFMYVLDVEDAFPRDSVVADASEAPA